MALVGPDPIVPVNPIAFLAREIRAERANPVPFPPGATSFSISRTRRFANDPLNLLLESYERFGPVFTLRILHEAVVFMIGPAANHHITVSHQHNFTHREGHYRDLIGLLGDGLLTIDGDFHRRSRMIMLPAFHRERVAGSLEVILEETEAAIEGLRPGSRVDMYAFTRHLTLRIAMRALFGLDPDGPAARELDAPGLFEQALSFYSSPYPLRFLRGPGSPWHLMQEAARRLDGLIHSEIAQRRASGRRGEDILSLLLDAEDEEGNVLSDRQIRDEVMTLMFAGHDTATSTIAFMLHELSRRPDVAAELAAEREALLAGRRPGAADLMGGELPVLEMVMEEILRMYPPAWIGPRHSLEPFEFEGVMVPGGAFVDYSTWVTHHLPEVFPDPFEFRPERFAADARSSLPRGAYLPFGGGSRMCIGMRFGQLEVRAIATTLLSHLSFEPVESSTMRVRQMPTLSPKDGLPLVVGEALPARTGAATASAA